MSVAVDSPNEGNEFNASRLMSALGGMGMSQPTVESLVHPGSSLRRQFERLDPIRAAATFAGLLTAPALQSNCFRIEALVAAALAVSRGKEAPSINFIKRAFKAFGEGPCGFSEDPAEDMFVTCVTYQAQNFLILEGLWEGAGFCLQRFLDVLGKLPQRADFNAIRSSTLSLLKLSDLVCRRANLKRWQLGGDSPLRELPPKSIESLALRRRYVRFAFSELESADIHVSSLSPFFLNMAARESLLTQKLGSTIIEQKPLVRDGNQIYFVLPTAVSAAIRYFVIQTMQDSGNNDNFISELAGVYGKLFNETPLLGGHTGAPIDFRRTKSGTFAQAVTKVDLGRYLHLVFVMDSLDDFSSTGLSGIDPAGLALGSSIDGIINSTYDHIAKKSDFRAGLTLLVSCGVGRGQLIPFGSQEFTSWRIESCSAYDLLTLSWTPQFSPLELWRILDARDEVTRLGTELMNINGLINLVGWARSLDGHMVPHAQMPESLAKGPGALMVMIDQTSQRKLRHESATTSDPRIEKFIDGRPIRLRRSNQSMFKEDETLPVYISEDFGQSGKPMVAYLAPNRIWWADVETAQGATEFAYERWRTIEVWLTKSAPVLDGSAWLSAGPLLWRAIFHGAVGEPMADDNVLTYDDACGAINTTVDIERRTIITEASDLYERAQFHPDNIAERALVAAFVKGVIQLASTAPKVELEALVDSIVKDPLARHGHAFRVRGFRDQFASELQRKVVRIEKEDDAIIKLGLGWRVRNQEQGSRIEGKSECTAFLNEIVENLEDQLIAEVKLFNRADLIRRLLENHERAAFDRDRWKRSSAAILALHEDRAAAIDTIASHDFRLNSVFHATRVVAEFAICEAPLDGGLAAGEMDLSRLMAIAILLSSIGSWSDAIRWDAMEPKLRITPLGDVHANFDWIDTVIRPYGQKLAGDRVASSERSYADNLKDYTVNPTIADKLDPAFGRAWEEQFGATIDQTRALLDFIEDIGIKSEKAIVAIKRSEISNVTVAGQSLLEPNLSALLGNLTFCHRASWREMPDGFDVKDRFPWRHRRRLSVLRRPFFQLDDTDDPSLMVAPGLLRDAVVYMIGNFWNGDFPEAQLSPRMRKWRATVIKGRGAKLGQEVAEKLNSLGWQTRVEIKVTELLGRKFDLNNGDVDVLAWHPDRGRVLVIECKDVQFRKTESDIAEQLSDYRGVIKEDGRRDDLLKHLDRISIINSHISSLKRITGMPNIDHVESHLVFRNPVPMKFALSQMSGQVQIHHLDEVILFQ